MGDVLTKDMYELIRLEVEKLQQQWKEAFADGKISLLDMVQLAYTMVAAFVKVVAVFDGLDAAQKRLAVLELVDRTYQEVIAPLDMPWVPDWLEGKVDTLLGQWLHVLAENLLDLMLLHRQVPGWVEKGN